MPDKLFYRQIHPKFVQNGRVTSQAFRTDKCEPLSVYDSKMFDPQSAWKHYTDNGYLSVGVMAVTDAECVAHDLEVVTDSVDFWGHASIKFGELSMTAKRKIAKYLVTDAVARGWCYQPTG